MQQRYYLILLVFFAIARPTEVMSHSQTQTAISLIAQSHIHPKQTTTNTTPRSSLFEQLNLTSRQKSQIKSIRRRYQGRIIKLKQELQIAQQQLAKMMAGTDSVASIRAKHDQISQVRQQLGQLHFESMLATREVLTPQQRQKFAEIIESR